MKWIAGFIGLVLLIGASIYVYQNYFTEPEVSINSFEECVAAGNPVMTSFPGQCSANGQTFIQDVGNGLEMEDMIRVESPGPGVSASSPLKITGQARGTWFFEGDFPILIVDSEGNELGRGFGTAEGEWMTEDFVPFTASVDFTSPTTTKGTLILQRDNPSGLPENDAQLIIPINFQ